MLENTIVVAGISGGKDSTALALWLIHESGIDRSRIILQFMDTGNEDALTYAFLDMLEKYVGEIDYVYPEEDFWQLAQRKRRFPSTRARFCTSELKVKPGQCNLSMWIDHAAMDGLKVIKVAGSRHEEGHSGNNRGDLPEFAGDAWTTAGRDYFCRIWYPIRTWTINDVWAIHRRYISMDDMVMLVEADPTMSDDAKRDLIGNMDREGIPRNPLYDMGAVRVGCFPCINSRKKEIRAMAHYRPERIDFIAEREEKDFVGVSNFSYSSMFARSTVPRRFRSRKLIDKRTGEYVEDIESTVLTDNDGEIAGVRIVNRGPMLVCTIHDVIEWSQTKHGGKQYEMFFPDENAGVCLIGGECE